MISEKDKTKLKNSILNDVYKNYDRTTSPFFESISLAIYFNNTCDQHDIALALKSLKADGFIEVDFSSDDNWSEHITITQKGIDYCLQNKGNKFIKYVKQNHLAIIDLFLTAIAIIVSIIALYYSLNQ